MKKIFKILFVLFIVVFQNGCTKQLEENPESILSPVNFYQSDKDFQAAITASYKAYYGSWSAFDNYNAFFLCGGAEDVTGKGYNRFDQMDPDPNSANILTVWTKIYIAINQANMIIAKAPLASAISDANKKTYEGQARYLRAYGFFYLTRWFGKVPLILTPEDSQNALDMAEAPVADIYTQIIADLTYAKTNLASSKNKLRPTKGAATALLAEVYLNMTGWPLKDASKYALARDEAKAVMDMNIYSLEYNFADIWKFSTKLSNSEVITMFNGIVGAGSNFHKSGRPSEEGGWEDFYTEARYMNDMPDGPRKTATFHTVFNTKPPISYTVSGAKQPFMQKYYDAGAGGTPTVLLGGNGENFFPISRYAEILLIYAEASNMATPGGPSSEALEAVNKVRRRAGGYDPLVYNDLPSGMTQAAFDTAVLNERYYELGCECKRWFDLVRKEMVVSVNLALYPKVNARNQLIPKPQDEVNLSKGKITQNTGY